MQPVRDFPGHAVHHVRRALMALTVSAVPQYPLPWRALWRLALPLWLATRLLLLVETYLAQALLAPRGPRSGFLSEQANGSHSLASLIATWRLWDGRWYALIATDGYRASDPAASVFYPLYPLLARPLTLLLGPTHTIEALLLVSNLATLAALLLLGALAVQELETLGAAERAMLLLLATPLALFLTAAYSDSLFLALVAGAFLGARRGQWRLVILLAFLAALTRPVAAALLAPLLAEYLRQMRRVDWRGVCVATSVPLAVGCYSLLCLRIYGDPLMWLHAERLFEHTGADPLTSLVSSWQQFWSLTPGSYAQARALVDLAPFTAVLLITVASIRRIPASYSLFLAGLLLIIMVTPVNGPFSPHLAYVSAGRYLLPAVPCYLLGAQLLKRYPWLERPLLSLGFATQALLIAFVVTGGWLV